jgi:hypothetical protein
MSTCVETWSRNHFSSHVSPIVSLAALKDDDDRYDVTSSKKSKQEVDVGVESLVQGFSRLATPRRSSRKRLSGKSSKPETIDISNESDLSESDHEEVRHPRLHYRRGKNPNLFQSILLISSRPYYFMARSPSLLYSSFSLHAAYMKTVCIQIVD